MRSVAAFLYHEGGSDADVDEVTDEDEKEDSDSDDDVEGHEWEESPRSDNPSHHAQHTKVSFPISTLSCKKNNPLRQLMLCKIPKLLITTWTWSRQPFPL